MVLLVLDASQASPPASVQAWLRDIGNDAAQSDGELDSSNAREGASDSSSQQLIVVYNKTDLLNASKQLTDAAQLRATSDSDPLHAWVSLKTGDNVDAVLDSLQVRCGWLLLRTTPRDLSWTAVQVAVRRLMSCDADLQYGHLLLTRKRQRVLLQEALLALERYDGVRDEHELAAEELRTAAHALGKLTGVIDPEAVLDVLFAEFCIGK